MRIGYIVKRYPQFANPFVMDEIADHERAGLDVDIFSLRPVRERHYRTAASRLRAPVEVVSPGTVKAVRYWEELRKAREAFPDLGRALNDSLDDDAADVRQALAVARMARSRDVRHLHAVRGGTAANVARIAAAMIGIRFSFATCSQDLEAPPDLFRKNAARASAVVASCHDTARAVRAHCDQIGVSCPTAVVPTGIDLGRTPLDNRPRGQAVVAMSRAGESSDFDDLIDALWVLVRTRPGVRATLVTAIDAVPVVAARVRSLEFADRIEVSAQGSEAWWFDRLRDASAMVAPPSASDRTGDDRPRAGVLESAALGTPFITHPEAPEPGGIRVRASDPRALADALKNIVDRPEKRRQVAATTRSLLEPHFDVRFTAPQLRKIIASPFEESSGRAAVASA